MEFPREPLVFLDFDGVIAPGAWSSSAAAPCPTGACPGSPKATWYAHAPRECTWFDPAAVARLDRLVREIGGAVVISSNWRISHKVEMLRQILRCRGYTGRVVGVTPDGEYNGLLFVGCYRNRGAEIAAWREANGHTGPFVILDDTDDMGDLVEHLVLTEYNEGLTDAHVDEAFALFGRQGVACP